MTRNTFKRKIYYSENIDINGFVAKVDYKKITRIYLRICGRDASVRITAPLKTPRKIINDFLSTKFAWIEKHRQKILQKKSTDNLTNNHQIRYLGQIFHIRFDYGDGQPEIIITNSEDLLPKHNLLSSINNLEIVNNNVATLLFLNASHIDKEKNYKFLEKFYRCQLQKIASNLLEKWQRIAQVKVEFLGIRKMRSRYGSCLPKSRKIWLSLSLIHYKIEFIEYVIVHEIAHFFVPNHSKKFYAKMTELLPNWREIKKLSRQ